jgi:hypothetical protein
MTVPELGSRPSPAPRPESILHARLAGVDLTGATIILLLLGCSLPAVRRMPDGR